MDMKIQLTTKISETDQELGLNLKQELDALGVGKVKFSGQILEILINCNASMKEDMTLTCHSKMMLWNILKRNPWFCRKKYGKTESQRCTRK